MTAGLFLRRKSRSFVETERSSRSRAPGLKDHLKAVQFKSYCTKCFFEKSERRIRFDDDCDDHGARARQTFILLEMHHLIQDSPTDGR